MKVVHWMALVAVIALVVPAQAQDRARTRGPAPSAAAPAAVGDPEIILYRISGVADDGGSDGTGVATSFHCTNYSGVTQTIRIVIRDFNTTLVANTAFNIDHLVTNTASTHGTVVYTEDELLLPLGISVQQGTAAIAATSKDIVCTAMSLDASAAVPVGIFLHAVRFNPASGTQE